MAHSVERFSAANVYNKPHLIQLQDLKSICGYIEKRSDSFAWRESLEASAMEANKQAVENKTNILTIYLRIIFINEILFLLLYLFGL